MYKIYIQTMHNIKAYEERKKNKERKKKKKQKNNII